MADHPCSKPKCKQEATIRQDVRPSWMSANEARRLVSDLGVHGEIRRYEVCDKHDEEFFAGLGPEGGFLNAKQSERIKEKLVPVSVDVF